MIIKTLEELKIYETEKGVEMISIASLWFNSKRDSSLFNHTFYTNCIAKRTDKLFVLVELNDRDFEIYISDLEEDNDIAYFRGFIEGMFAVRNESICISI